MDWFVDGSFERYGLAVFERPVDDPTRSLRQVLGWLVEDELPLVATSFELLAWDHVVDDQLALEGLGE